MPSKLTQAEKQRRAGVRMALRIVLEHRHRYAEALTRTVVSEFSRQTCELIEGEVRALLAPKRKKRSTVRSALTEQAIQDAEKARKRGKGARG